MLACFQLRRWEWPSNMYSDLIFAYHGCERQTEWNPILDVILMSSFYVLCLRICVNGSHIQGKTALRHGDRILLGNYHFFRINCPRPPGVGKLPNHHALTNKFNTSCGNWNLIHFVGIQPTFNTIQYKMWEFNVNVVFREMSWSEILVIVLFVGT